MKKINSSHASQKMPQGNAGFDMRWFWAGPLSIVIFFSNFAGLWLARLINNHVGIYGSNWAEVFSAFQRRSCYSSVGLVGIFAGLLPRTVPSAIVHCTQNEAGHQEMIKTPSMPCLSAAGPWKYFLAFMSQDEICISGKLSVQEPSEWGVFLHTCK